VRASTHPARTSHLDRHDLQEPVARRAAWLSASVERCKKSTTGGSTTDRPEPQLATAPLRESHVTAQEMAQAFDRLDPATRTR
jgi:hypothetical protein